MTTIYLENNVTVYGEKPDNINLYIEIKEPSWYILLPQNDGLSGAMLKSSLLLVISKSSGNVLYYGSANDEG